MKDTPEEANWNKVKIDLTIENLPALCKLDRRAEIELTEILKNRTIEFLKTLPSVLNL